MHQLILLKEDVRPPKLLFLYLGLLKNFRKYIPVSQKFHSSPTELAGASLNGMGSEKSIETNFGSVKLKQTLVV